MFPNNTYKSMVKTPPLADIFSDQKEREDAMREKVVQLAVSELYDFPNHPFQVRDDEEMNKLAESIKQYGVLVPVIVRPRQQGGYEMISGHRRKYATELAGKNELPCLIREVDDDTAIVLMVDSNVQRENILPSEKAKAFKMKLEAVKRKAGRPQENNSPQVAANYRSDDAVAKDAGISGDTVRRYICLNNLIPELQQMVDAKQLKFNPAVEISYLTEQEQRAFYDYTESQSCTPSLSQAQKLKGASREHTLDADQLHKIMAAQPSRKKEQPIQLPREKLSRYFSSSCSVEQIVNQILKMLEHQYRKRRQEHER